jgi:hypothetical protein
MKLESLAIKQSNGAIGERQYASKRLSPKFPGKWRKVSCRAWPKSHWEESQNLPGINDRICM